MVECDILRNKNRLAPEVIDLIRERMAAIPGSELKLVSNLPYSVATPVVSNLVAGHHLANFDGAVLQHRVRIA
jgi:16S rRNA (adenine1518-N6/adenine1519-N6)-dimethyltransferase